LNESRTSKPSPSWCGALARLGWAIRKIRQRKWGRSFQKSNVKSPNVMSASDLRRAQRLPRAGGGLDGAEFRSGYYYLPTIFTNVTNQMRIAQEEIFGPVVCVISFDSEEEAINLANGTEFGLATSIWTRGLARAANVLLLGRPRPCARSRPPNQ
jgi:hypothetical protein